MFTEEYQVESLRQYFPVFDKLKKDFFVGEMIWNFADFATAQGQLYDDLPFPCKVILDHPMKPEYTNLYQLYIYKTLS